MKDRVVVICMEMFKRRDLINFRGKTAIDKIKLIFENITTICEMMREKEPNALWIIGWREFGITDGALTRYVSQEVLQYFHQAMSTLTNHYPNLAIIGSLATEKKLDDSQAIEQKAQKIEKDFEDYAWIREEEGKADDREISLHLKQARNIKLSSKQSASIIRNNVYVYQKGRSIQKVRKKAPFSEMRIPGASALGKRSNSRQMFKPPTKKSQNPIVTLIHPVSKKTIKVGIEICREHCMGVLKHTKAPEPLLHIVPSDSIPLEPCNLYGHYVVPFSSANQTQLVELKKDPLYEVELYRYNLLREDKYLYGPLLSFYPLEFKILDFLKTVIQELPATHPSMRDLMQIKVLAEISSQNFTRLEACVRKKIAEHKSKMRSFFKIQSDIDIVPALKQILKMITDFRADPNSQKLNTDLLAPLKHPIVKEKSKSIEEIKRVDMTKSKNII
ncbi:MAG: hypothetical protein ACYCQI_13235 [Gammaproteobacteria bacterium]